MDKSEMHYFDPNIPYVGVDRFIKSAYEAYFYFKKVSASYVFDFHLKSFNEKYDIYILFEVAARKTQFEHEKFAKNVHQLKWNDRKGAEIENHNKEIIFQSPASTLLHELAYGLYYLIVGKKEYERLHSTGPLNPKFDNRYNSATRLEEIIVSEYENPATKAVGEGIRNRYHGIFHDVPSVISMPNK